MKQQWTAEELEDFWMLHPEEFKLLQNKSGETRLSFVFMLKYFKLFNDFPNDKDVIPQSIVSYLAKQVDVENITLKTYHFTSRVGTVHRRQIRDFLGFRPSKKSDTAIFINWLVEKVLPEGKDSMSYLKEKSYGYFRQIKVEPFSPLKIERHILSALNTFESTLFKTLSKALTHENKKSLLDLLELQESQSPEAYYLLIST